MRVTIQDIAKAASVTPSTVSRVIAGSPLISAKTSQKVRKVMREMDYHPNIIARSLVRRSTNIIGVLLPGASERVFQHPFFFELLRGITMQAQLCGYSILLSGAGSEEEERNRLHDFANGGVTEGAILMISRTDSTDWESVYPAQFPLAMVGRPADAWKDRINWVDSDNLEAGYRLAGHFLAKGRRHIAFVGLAPNIVVTKDRYEGYRKALGEAGLPFDERLVVDGQFMGGDERVLTEELLRCGVPFDGLIAADDFQALAAMDVLAKQGVRVPQDVSVAGFNNVPLSEYYRPPLTTVDVNACALGEEAVRLLYRQLQEKDRSGPSHTIVPTRLVVRASA
ncbi:LacI family DNA-binding transcriptional regulator [Ethanoligenens harbinense]|uniref:Transcriptional regulator, LacI family n=1 Tax=Ethanoligenens harbinense (strain DSM 18485 / JCM 12961 / CGMCC 1.5033 / YUAN-3) TaxID=663278 RepID=E6U714_ETHHY|nr:LacI family DNA-binding transcriptional regulator [Ethanoligenens harbinense]ADU28084.1 transcriptional regulator, LacI family [Ethanoligenens harbinense YUAN-3]AVQ97096.1 LacI family transcriptional regulator [Ethanoligenens harbinense YUAN-3]AYF39758.1 LacI family transcriptional regulator [Ethanoligenens harbinense]AYF42591.1 LacI family transcriptional regulator [Ethanoligenens harbinense]QCN93339.1 LacI family transcriptional regulator [Ethanoligenens harbinense]